MHDTQSPSTCLSTATSTACKHVPKRCTYVHTYLQTTTTSEISSSYVRDARVHSKEDSSAVEWMHALRDEDYTGPEYGDAAYNRLSTDGQDAADRKLIPEGWSA